VAWLLRYWSGLNWVKASVTIAFHQDDYNCRKKARLLSQSQRNWWKDWKRNKSQQEKTQNGQLIMSCWSKKWPRWMLILVFPFLSCSIHFLHAHFHLLVRYTVTAGSRIPVLVSIPVSFRLCISPIQKSRVEILSLIKVSLSKVRFK